MGSGIAKNLIRHGFQTVGFDLSSERMEAFASMGGIAATNPGGVGEGAHCVFIMVMNGGQARSVIFGDDGLVRTMDSGSAIILTATITVSEVRAIASDLTEYGIHLVDSPVSGGFPGAQAGTLSIMAAAEPGLLEKYRPVLEAVGSKIHHVGDEPGLGQSVKACLQSLIGSIFTATFEASALAAKAGVDADALFEVFKTSSAGCGAVNTALENIIESRFERTGSHINTMHKDLTISMDLARELGVPLFTASSAMQLFQAGKTKFPNGDNWITARISEEIVGAALRRKDDGE